MRVMSDIIEGRKTSLPPRHVEAHVEPEAASVPMATALAATISSNDRFVTYYVRYADKRHI